MSKSDYLENRVLDAVLNNVALAVAQAHVSPHTADPGEDGAGAECAGGSYAREPASFAAAAGGTAANDAEIAFDFTGYAGAVTVTHFGLWDAATLGNLLYAGALAQAAFDRMLEASESWSAGVRRALRDYGREAEDMARTFENATTSALKASEDAFVAWARTGKLSAADLFASLEEAALRAAYRMLVFKPLEGFLQGQLGNVSLDLFGGGSTVYAPSPLHNSAFGLLGHAHQGGMVGGPNAFETRPVPLAAFADAPRLHGGGLVAPGEVPIVAHRGEVVGWPEQLRRVFGSEVIVQIIDQRSSGTRPEVSRERGPDGREVVRVPIREEVGRGLAQGWWDQTMGSAYGLNRRGASR